MSGGDAMLVDTGRAQLARIMAGLVGSENLQWHLYTNSIVWAHDTVIGDLTEAAWSGYAHGTTLLAEWSPPVADGSFDQVSLSTVSVPYTNSSGGTVTADGWYVVGSTRGTFYGGKPFSTPLSILGGQTGS